MDEQRTMESVHHMVSEARVEVAQIIRDGFESIAEAKAVIALHDHLAKALVLLAPMTQRPLSPQDRQGELPTELEAMPEPQGDHWEDSYGHRLLPRTPKTPCPACPTAALSARRYTKRTTPASNSSKRRKHEVSRWHHSLH